MLLELLRRKARHAVGHRTMREVVGALAREVESLQWTWSHLSETQWHGEHGESPGGGCVMPWKKVTPPGPRTADVPRRHAGSSWTAMRVCVVD